MNQFLEDFDDNELRDYFLGQPKESPLICCRCGKAIPECPDHTRITLTNKANGRLHFHEACFEDLFDRLVRWSGRESPTSDRVTRE